MTIAREGRERVSVSESVVMVGGLVASESVSGWVVVY